MSLEKRKFDVCVVGSGAGAGPVIYQLSKAGYSVIVLEKGPFFRTEDFTKDEITAIRRSVYTPNLKDEQHVIESKDDNGNWIEQSTYSTGNDFWNGNCVGGSSNFMSGYFQRLKPIDFRLLTEFGEIEGANVVDWPLSYDDLEPYYTKVEKIVGVSGKVVQHSQLEPRSTEDFPYPPLGENIVSKWIDDAGKKNDIEVIPMPRAILSRPKDDRNACVYSNYCGSYGCSSDAKGSSRVALIYSALKTGNCTLVPNAKVYHLDTGGGNKVERAWFYDVENKKISIEADVFVVAAQAVETSRLLLMSKNKKFPNGLGNNNGLVGKNIIFSAGGIGGGDFYLNEMSAQEATQLKIPGLFVNRTIHQFYEYIDEKTQKRIKGGTIDFLFEHANAMTKAIKQKWDKDDSLLYGKRLQNKIKNYFSNVRKLKFEVFADWLPNDDCFVTLDKNVRDKWGDPVAKIRTGYHQHDIQVGQFLASKGEKILRTMGAKNVYSGVSGSPPSNLQAGGCRFGNDPNHSVLNKNCRLHEVDNLYVSDGSFMPTGGSVTYTWTIYANSFRVADEIIKSMR